MIPDSIQEGLTFDDILLVPARSSVVPAETDARTMFTRKVALNIPITSSAMDTVTESHLAIALAREGGIGVVHKNMSIDRQVEEVDKVKRSESGMIVDPVTIHADQPIADALDLMVPVALIQRAEDGPASLVLQDPLAGELAALYPGQ